MFTGIIEEVGEVVEARVGLLRVRVLLCDRDERAKLLTEQMLGAPQPGLACADSTDEVVAFVIAIIRASMPAWPTASRSSASRPSTGSRRRCTSPSSPR